MQSSETATVLIHLVASISMGILLLVLLCCIRFAQFRAFVCWAIVRWIDPDEFDEGTYAYDFCLALRAWLSPTVDVVSNDACSAEAAYFQAGAIGQRYPLGAQTGTSRCYDVYPTTDGRHIVKVARDRTGIRTLAGEYKTLLHLRSHANGKAYADYLPLVAEQTRVGGKPAWVYEKAPGDWRTAESIVADFPQGLPGVHIAWMFNRILEAIGFAHQQGTAHSAIMPRHLLFETNTHSLQLVDWTHAKRIGCELTFIPKRYRRWYPDEATIRASPQTDIFMAAKTVVLLAGGDATAQEIRHTIPVPIRQFLKACLLKSSRMRPDDAWELHDEFRDILELVYGAPTFHRFPSVERVG